MDEQVLRLTHAIEVHLLYASIVWLAASLLTSMQRGSATVKYWIWVATAIRPALPQNKPAPLLRNDMALERAFVAAGGLLLAGPDPVGIGGNIPGFGDQRELELLVEAGFSPFGAIHIATSNGATFLGRQQQIGSIAVGKNAIDGSEVRGRLGHRNAGARHPSRRHDERGGTARLAESRRCDRDGEVCRSHRRGGRSDG